MKRTRLGPGAKSLERGSTFANPRSELARVSPKKAAQSKGKTYSTIDRRQPKRDWSLAREKVELEGCCRFCGEPMPIDRLQACHIDGRDRDGFDPVTQEPRPQPWVVEPDRVVPGCPTCHSLYDEGRLDLIGKLTMAEEVQIVRDRFPAAGPGRGSGIELARHRLSPSSYRRGAV